MKAQETMELIFNSLMNGQNTQALEYIKDFGVKKFIDEYSSYLYNDLLYSHEDRYVALYNVMNLIIKSRYTEIIFDFTRGEVMDELLKELIGKVIVNIDYDGISMIFTLENGDKYMFYHRQDCCESVEIEDICGDIDDLLNTPLVMAEEITSCENPEGYVPDQFQDSFTWTFYKFATIKGYVTVRWYGESNGYYSEEVSIKKIDKLTSVNNW